MDYCTGFFEHWYTWKFKKIYIGEFCKKHDEACGTFGFFKDLWNARVVGAIPIATVASIACFFKYPRKIINRWFKKDVI